MMNIFKRIFISFDKAETGFKIGLIIDRYEGTSLKTDFTSIELWFNRSRINIVIVDKL